MKRFILLLLACACLFIPDSGLSAVGNDAWPTRGWALSPPEMQGMDSSKLAAMLKFIDDQAIPLHSVLIVRHGYLVSETYFAPYRKDVIQDICSCTKSFTSAAIGAAIADHRIAGIDQKVLSFFPDRSIANRDTHKEKMTLENLLTMTSGLDWPEWGIAYSNGENVHYGMTRSADWVQYILDRKMAEAAGTRFNYCSGSSHLLSAVIRQTSGKKTATYVSEKIFQPLGIQAYHWLEDPTGLNSGGGGLAMTPESMAKFGYLYLRNGRWEGRPLLPADWVQASTRKHVEIGRDGGFGYGYQWWIDPWGYSARGWGGQFIFVIPEKDLVVVFTGSLPNTHFFLPEHLLTSFIIPAIKSEEALAENPPAYKRLKALEASAQAPKPQKVEAYPLMAQKISGKTIEVSSNPLGLRSIMFRFVKTGECRVTSGYDSGTYNLAVGLDDTYRHTVIPDIGEFAAKGCWLADDTFELVVHNLIWPDVEIYNFTFIGNKVQVEWKSYIENGRMSFEGKLPS